MNGKGIYSYANGDKYDGDYKDDKRNGKGIVTYANGNKEEQVWKNGIKQ
jgi:hypothetical protein